MPNGNKQWTNQRCSLLWKRTKLQHPVLPRHIRAASHGISIRVWPESTAYRTEIRTSRTSPILTQCWKLEWSPASLFVCCSNRAIKRKVHVTQDFTDQPRVHFARGKARRTPITRTITACQVTDYTTKITYCFQTVPSSSEKAAFTQAVFLSLTTLSLRSWMARLNKQAVRSKLVGLQWTREVS